MTRKLTLKQSDFCKWYIHPDVKGNGTEAARRAGYKGTDKVLGQVALENLKKPVILEEIERLRQEIGEDVQVSIEKVLNDLEELRVKAMDDGKYQAAVRASELQGKWLKMFTDRIEHVQSLDEISDGDLDKLLIELLGNLSGDDLNRILTEIAGQRGSGVIAPGTATAH